MVPKTECDARIERLQKELRKEVIDGALFVYPIDVYYFTGVRQNAVLWVPTDGAPTLFVRKSLIRAREESCIPDVRPFPASREFADNFPENIQRIGLTFDILPVLQYQYYAKLLGNKELVDLSDINRRMRSVKSAWEIDQMRESGRRLSEVFRLVPSFLKRGMRERDLAAEIEFRLRSKWSEGSLRMRAFNQEITGLAVAGERAAAPGCFDGPVTGRGLSNSSPYGPSDALILEDSPILIDYPGIFNGYIVDMSRIFIFGKLEPAMRRAFEVSLEIQSWLMDSIRPGAICEDLFWGAAGIAEGAGLKENFMGYPGEQARFVGHGVGLELDELPVLAQKFRTPLQEGQTIAIEPKFIFPGRGAVGIENTVAVTQSGCEKLTDLPDELVCL
ncbi:MAG: aminopeptidase P family protein [Thermodesulfovibrio sp.]|nr:aminopeptidase P family protein [Thermodesulfovibrio sp.]